MIIRTRAIVLNHFRYGESSLVVNLYTEVSGRQTVFVKAVTNKKSRMKPVMFQPLHLVDIEMHHRANRQMQRISSIQICQILFSIPFDPVKSSIAIFITEILTRTLKEEIPDPELFGFLFDAIQTLDLCENGKANFHLLFLIHYSRYLGFYPDSIPDVSRFKEGTWESADGLFRQLVQTGFGQIADINLNQYQRNLLTESLLSFYSAHIDGFGAIKSYPVLKNVFQD